MEFVTKKGVIAYHTVKNQFHIVGMFCLHLISTLFELKHISTETKKQKIIKKLFVSETCSRFYSWNWMKLCLTINTNVNLNRY